MNVFKNKNDYSVIVYITNGKTMTMEYVNSIYQLAQWLDRKQIKWKYLNIYIRRNRQFLKRQYSNKFIEAKPKF